MEQFQQNIKVYQVEQNRLANQRNQLAIIRLAVFVLSVALITWLANERQGYALLWVVPLAVGLFGWVVNRYNKVSYRLRHTEYLSDVNSWELKKLANDLAEFEGGKNFILPDHPYAADLDVFGTHSLFQLMDRTTTESGQQLLAHWLMNPATEHAIRDRQAAVKELAPRLAWRQQMQALGMHHYHPDSNYRQLQVWVHSPAKLLAKQRLFLTLAPVMGLLSTAALINFLLHVFTSDALLHLVPLLLVCIINYIILRRVSPVAEEILQNMHSNVKVLGSYQLLISSIETENFTSPLLNKLKSQVVDSEHSAARAIRKLQRILEVFQMKGLRKSVESNKLYPLFNILWLLDIYWIILTERWKQQHSKSLESWIDAVSNFEALNSLAGLTFANPSLTFPEISSEPFTVQFNKLGHPLIDSTKRVCNSFRLQGRGEIAMITGSNMAGKSTFLRTVGINLVLAFTGAPCCAQSGEVSVLKVFTSMRTQDNLEEGISSFYAELRKIEQLLSYIQSREPIFFLLDEMFKGTNSEDRHKGGFSLIKQLSELNSFGMISTHDLDLAKLAEKHHMVTNYSFNSDIKDDEISFSYVLDNQICRDFNASALMKKSGIKILPSIDFE